MIDARNASHVESSSPAQWHGAEPAPVNPARLNVTPSTPASREQVVVRLRRSAAGSRLFAVVAAGAVG